MPENAGEYKECLKILELVGMQVGLLEKVATDASTGIIGDAKDIERRQNIYGQNNRKIPAIRSFF